MDVIYLPPVLGVLGLIVAFIIYKLVTRYPAGEGLVAQIAEEIHTGAMVFLKREYSILAMFCAVVIILLFIGFKSWHTPLAFVIGALCSASAGFAGMFAATKANVRTTVAANTEGPATALSVAFYGGAVMGLTVASMGLLGLGILYLLFGSDHHSCSAPPRIFRYFS